MNPVQDTNPITPPTPDMDEVLSVLGGRFAADMAAIVEKAASRPPVMEEHPEQIAAPVEMDAEDAHRQFALARIRAGNIRGAVDFIERHAPQLLGWLRQQVPSFFESGTTTAEPEESEQVDTYGTVLIDAEMGRISYLLGQFTIFRGWAYAHVADDGDGNIARSELETTWVSAGIAKSKRHARRLLQQGIAAGYWTYDRRTKRVYLTGQVKLATKLVQAAYDQKLDGLIETDKPGKRRVHVDLSGSIGDAVARLYAAWWVAKDPDREGRMISRERLCALWQVSVPTLLAWEDAAHIRKRQNYAQSNETWVNAVPAYAYLTLNRDGTYATAWRLPNTYTVQDQQIEQHPHTGKSHHIKQAFRGEKHRIRPRGSTGDAALLPSDRCYFTDAERYAQDAFSACRDYVRKLGRRNGDVFRTRYFTVGERYGVRIFEPYFPATKCQETHIAQRLIWQEDDPDFVAARAEFRCVLEDHHAYIKALA